jgi:hypothetical protein
VSGLVLVVLIGVIVAYGYTRLRGRMKLSVSGKHWVAPAIAVVLFLLILWAAHNGH